MRVLTDDAKANLKAIRARQTEANVTVEDLRLDVIFLLKQLDACAGRGSFFGRLADKEQKQRKELESEVLRLKYSAR